MKSYFPFLIIFFALCAVLSSCAPDQNAVSSPSVPKAEEDLSVFSDPEPVAVSRPDDLPADSSVTEDESPTDITESPSVDPEPYVDPEPSEPPEPGDADLVRVADYISDIFIELRYATENNFTNKVIYDFDDAYLRYGTVKKLSSVQMELEAMGLSLKIWDAFRPQYAQFLLWDVVPDAKFVANPYKGHSSHSNGGTVDITLVTLDGEDIEMPSEFDEFGPTADRDYSDVSEAARANALVLEELMIKYGFKPYKNEWWHYADNDPYGFDDVADFGAA